MKKGVRVCVRVRPKVDKDASADDCSLLGVDEAANTVAIDRRKEFKFDRVFGADTNQEQLHKHAGIDELVRSATQGIHATVFAYGQTGSGKTWTMEGFNYTGGAPALPSGSQSFSAKATPPSADFKNTPPEQLGIVPRAAEALFQEIKQNSTGRRFTVRCSYVQLYKEQAYDLLNPAPTAPGLAPVAKAGNPAGLGAPLRMRWSKADDFYLENLFKVECANCEEVLAAFKRGVACKAMAAHRLNDASSRSHCLCTLYIDSAPIASPSEVISSRLTLVDLAGSERSAQTGATDGSLRDESLAINKSLFTLRQVVMALSANSSLPQNQQQQQPPSPSRSTPNAAPGSGLGGGPAGSVCPAHVPYRDSKLTALLKNSLGGNTLTTMIACISPANSAVEENISTLEYAARAKRVTNQVTVNEDPKTRVIRELRAEVAFLRSQLATLQGPDAAAALAIPSTLCLPHPLSLPHGSNKGPPEPTSPSKAGLPPKPPLPPHQQRLLIKGDASPASSPGSPSRLPGVPTTPSALARRNSGDFSPAGTPDTMSPSSSIPRSGSAEALASGRGTQSVQSLPRSGSLDGQPLPRSASLPEGSAQAAPQPPRGAVAALTDLGSLEQVGSGPSLPVGESFTSVKAQLLRATHMDVGVLAHKLLDAVGLVQQLSTANQQLRKAYNASAVSGENSRAENEELMMENVQLRERLSLLEGLAGIADPVTPTHPRATKSSSSNSQHGQDRPSPSLNSSMSSGVVQPTTPTGSTSYNGLGQGSAAPPAGIMTASSSALMELQELRKENALLHARVHKAEALAQQHQALHPSLPPPAPFRRPSPSTRPTLSQSLPAMHPLHYASHLPISSLPDTHPHPPSTASSVVSGQPHPHPHAHALRPLASSPTPTLPVTNQTPPHTALSLGSGSAHLTGRPPPLVTSSASVNLPLNVGSSSSHSPSGLAGGGVGAGVPRYAPAGMRAGLTSSGSGLSVSGGSVPTGSREPSSNGAAPALLHHQHHHHQQQQQQQQQQEGVVPAAPQNGGALTPLQPVPPNMHTGVTSSSAAGTALAAAAANTGAATGAAGGSAGTGPYRLATNSSTVGMAQGSGTSTPTGGSGGGVPKATLPMHPQLAHQLSQQQQQQQGPPLQHSTSGSSTTTTASVASHPTLQQPSSGSTHGQSAHHAPDYPHHSPHPPTPSLSHITQQMSARALTSGLRMSTTGALLGGNAAQPQSSISSSGGNAVAGSGGVIGRPSNSTHNNNNTTAGSATSQGVQPGVGLATPSASFTTSGGAAAHLEQGVGVLSGGPLVSSSSSFPPGGSGPRASNTSGGGSVGSNSFVSGGFVSGGGRHSSGGHSAGGLSGAGVSDLDRDSGGDGGQDGAPAGAGASGGVGESAERLVHLFQARSAMSRSRMLP